MQCYRTANIVDDAKSRDEFYRTNQSRSNIESKAKNDGRWFCSPLSRRRTSRSKWWFKYGKIGSNSINSNINSILLLGCTEFFGIIIIAPLWDTLCSENKFPLIRCDIMLWFLDMAIRASLHTYWIWRWCIFVPQRDNSRLIRLWRLVSSWHHRHFAMVKPFLRNTIRLFHQCYNSIIHQTWHKVMLWLWKISIHLDQTLDRLQYPLQCEWIKGRDIDI